MNKLVKLVAASTLVFVANAAHSGAVDFGSYSGNMVKTVNGAWTYNEKLSFSSTGTYQLNFSDLNFGDKFDYVGAMISTPTQKLASFTYKNGDPSSLLPVEFQVGEQDYWVSVFAMTNSVSDIGTLGLDISRVGDISEVPAPSAFVLMFSSLFGLANLVRRSRKAKSKKDKEDTSSSNSIVMA